MPIIWIIVFIVSLFVLVKSADYMIASAEKIGLAFGLSPFVVGITIVGLGTSFPELIAAFVAVFNNVPEVVVANVVGSNIANILLVVGISAVVAKKLVVTKSLIDLDLPLLSIGTVLLLGIVWDQQITFGESILMILTYAVYLIYTVSHKDVVDSPEVPEIMPTRQERRRKIVQEEPACFDRPKLVIMDFIILISSMAGLLLGANYLIKALVKISAYFDIGVGLITVTAVAIGTSLPELIVSVKAALQRKSELALGNIFGSNIFNSLVVIGLPGLFSNLIVEEQIFSIGIPTLAFATLLFVISGISRRVYIWEGAFYLSIYVLFTAKLFSWF